MFDKFMNQIKKIPNYKLEKRKQKTKEYVYKNYSEWFLELYQKTGNVFFYFFVYKLKKENENVNNKVVKTIIPSIVIQDLTNIRNIFDEINRSNGNGVNIDKVKQAILNDEFYKERFSMKNAFHTKISIRVKDIKWYDVHTVVEIMSIYNSIMTTIRMNIKIIKLTIENAEYLKVLNSYITYMNNYWKLINNSILKDLFESDIANVDILPPKDNIFYGSL